MFPTTPVDLLVEAAWGADRTADPDSWTWTDLSAEVPVVRNGVATIRSRLLSEKVRITRGRQDQAGQVSPSSVSLLFDNTDGALTPGLRTGRYYPNVAKGNPLRISVDGPSYLTAGDSLATSQLQTVDTAGNSITGDIDIRVLIEQPVRTPGVTQKLVSKWLTTGNQRSWRVTLGPHVSIIDTHNIPYYSWSSNGTAEVTVAATKQLPGTPRLALRITHDVNNGASGNTVTFYTGPSLDGPWTQLGDPVVTASTTSIFDSTAPVALANDSSTVNLSWAGKIYGFSLYNGIGGTLVSRLDLRAAAAGSSSVVATTGETWTLGVGSSISDRHYRFHGDMTAIRPEWPSGDVSTATDPGESVCTIEAHGDLFRLNQSQAVFQSALYRSITSLPAAVYAYWPMEDEVGSASAAAAIPNTLPMRIPNGWQWAESISALGSKPLPVVPGNGESADGRTPGTMPQGEWSVAFLYRAPSVPSTVTLLGVDAYSSGIDRWLVTATSTELTVWAYKGETLVLLNTSAIGTDVYTGWNWFQLTARTNGADTDWAWTVTNVGGSVGGTSGTITSRTAGRPATVQMYGGAGWAMGHCFVSEIINLEALPTSLLALPVDGYRYEVAGRRLERIGNEELIDLDVVGAIDETEYMGAQRPLDLMRIIQDCVDVDLGFLSERRNGPGLVYRPRRDLYNAPIEVTLDASANHIANPFLPVDDYQRRNNQIEVQRTDGDAYTLATPGYVAGSELRFPSSVELNVGYDHQAAEQAGWRLTLGTMDGMKYSALSYDAFFAPDRLDDVMALAEGSLIQVNNLPPQHPDDNLLLVVEGSVEQISRHGWTFDLFCSPGQVYQVSTVEGTGRLDSDGSELASSITESSTSLSVAVTSGDLWITSAAFASQFPFDIEIDGERMTVTALSGASSPQTFTVTRPSDAVAHATGAEVHVAEQIVLTL